jgi:hypothetical protein
LLLLLLLLLVVVVLLLLFLLMLMIMMMTTTTKYLSDTKINSQNITNVFTIHDIAQFPYQLPKGPNKDYMF